MATLADIQTAMAASQTAQQRIMGMLQTQQASLIEFAAKLADALASGNPDAIGAIVAQMQHDTAAMNAAVDSLPPIPAPTPQPAPVPPGPPVIS